MLFGIGLLYVGIIHRGRAALDVCIQFSKLIAECKRKRCMESTLPRPGWKRWSETWRVLPIPYRYEGICIHYDGKPAFKELPVEIQVIAEGVSGSSLDKYGWWWIPRFSSQSDSPGKLLLGIGPALELPPAVALAYQRSPVLNPVKSGVQAKIGVPVYSSRWKTSKCNTSAIGDISVGVVHYACACKTVA